ncbi:MAG: ChbG/HpnK family deacetylase [Acidobacteria bacterium]|nr:ChbG/HpnK family deacetylase [Acidobacteriota bacterium]
MRALVLALWAVWICQAAEPIRLIVRGDDFGYTHASNMALEKAFEDGVMQSASLLTPGPWFSETARIIRGHPEWSVGVHLTITSEWNTLRWRPVSPISAVPSLVAPDGYLYGFGYRAPRPADWKADGAPWAEHAPNPVEAEHEFRAQIERALGLGLQLDYVDCHMAMACREDLLPITQKLAQQYCLGISGGGMFGEKRFSPKYPDTTRAGIKKALLTALRELEPGLYLYVGHPAEDAPELRAVDTNDGVWWAERRSSVLAAWTDPEVRAEIERKGIELVSIGSLFDKQACAPR